MSAYIIIRARIFDLEPMRSYFAAIDTVIRQHGGRFLVRAPASVLEGDDDGRFAVILEFPDSGKVHSFWNSTEAQPLFEMRRKHSSVVAVTAVGIT
jgi:uncharacterized protein (DUF1330 family)